MAPRRIPALEKDYGVPPMPGAVDFAGFLAGASNSPIGGISAVGLSVGALFRFRRRRMSNIVGHMAI